jgi:hypothetical protein
MSEHIEDYSHLVQQVELRHGIDRKGAADSNVEARSHGPSCEKRREQGAPQKACSTCHAFLRGANQFTIDIMTGHPLHGELRPLCATDDRRWA